MSGNYEPLSKHIRLVDTRNADMVTDRLLGINIDKYFMPSVANVIGTDLSRYKLISKGVFACNPMHVGRDERLPVALYSEDKPAIVSPAYFMFEIIDQSVLLPDYLMMWFRRAEFDRICWLKTDGSVRGGLSWDDLGRMELPVPYLDKQRAVVKAYQTITDRIALKRAINDNLEATAGAIFIELFGTTSTSHSSLNELVELGSFVDFIDGDRGSNYPQQNDFAPDGYCLFLNASNVTAKGFNFDSRAFISKERDELLRKGKLSRNDIVLTSRGTIGNVVFYGKHIPFSNIRINSGMLIIRPKSSAYPPHFLYALARSRYMAMAIEQFTSGSAQPQLPIKDLQRIQIPLPTAPEKIKEVDSRIEALDDAITINNNEIQALSVLCDSLLSNLAR
jgi:type I restriction enzyme S subunit